jgi:predicted Zn-dependent protease with MMP-like domain/Flp pilus assembly protein TadD
MRHFLPVLALLALTGCSRLFGSSADAGTQDGGAGSCSNRPAPLPPCSAGDGDYLTRARSHYDEGDYSGALACSAQACGATPDDADAHGERGWDLVALDRLDEARTAYARALALDPDSFDALQGAAELYLKRLPSSRDFNELGLAYAERGHAIAVKQADKVGAARLALLSASALNDLGRPTLAVERAQEAIEGGVDADEARYEKASALWELCRFPEARREFKALGEVQDKAAQAHHYLGLIAEREGDPVSAERELAAARKLDPDAYPPELKISPEEYAQLVAAAAKGLPADIRHDLEGVPVTTEDIPKLEDLTASDPPLSPTIVGLFRGPSLAEPCDGTESPCRSIVLYRKNMVRTVQDRADLEKEIGVTLLHEVGHLRGEDDTQLVARGLE